MNSQERQTVNDHTVLLVKGDQEVRSDYKNDRKLLVRK